MYLLVYNLNNSTICCYSPSMHKYENMVDVCVSYLYKIQILKIIVAFVPSIQPRPHQYCHCHHVWLPGVLFLYCTQHHEALTFSIDPCCCPYRRPHCWHHIHQGVHEAQKWFMSWFCVLATLYCKQKHKRKKIIVQKVYIDTLLCLFFEEYVT